MRQMLERIAKSPHFEVVIFAEAQILNDAVELWPRCDCLISFYSTGFPLAKVRGRRTRGRRARGRRCVGADSDVGSQQHLGARAGTQLWSNPKCVCVCVWGEQAEAYARLRQPFLVNDVATQRYLLDRREMYRICMENGIPLPRFAVMSRSDMHRRANGNQPALLLVGEPHAAPPGCWCGYRVNALGTSSWSTPSSLKRMPCRCGPPGRGRAQRGSGLRGARPYIAAAAARCADQRHTT